MSEPTCANCPKGKPYQRGTVECRAHPPLVEFGESAEFPILASGEYCHEHPALQAHAEVSAGSVRERHSTPIDPKRDTCEVCGCEVYSWDDGGIIAHHANDCSVHSGLLVECSFGPLDEDARALVMSDDFFADLEGVSIDADGCVVFEDQDAALRFAKRRLPSMRRASDDTAHELRPGPRDMCELEEGGRPDSDAVLCACGGDAVVATQGAYGAIVGTCAACMQGSRVIDVRETPSEEAPSSHGRE